MKRLLLLGGALLSLSACATAQPYGGADIGRRNGPGLYETPISADRIRIVHSAPRGMPPAQAEDAALLRAAERTISSGFEWFVVDQRYTEVTGGGRSNGPFVSIGGGSSRFGGFSASGLGGSIGFNLGGASQPAATSTIEVRMGRGARPEGAYDARDVQRTIGPRQGVGRNVYPW